jgi:hypothetical protein
MAQDKKGKIAAYIGGTMVTLATTALALRLAGWATDNTKALDVAVIVFLILAIPPFVYWHRTKDETETPAVNPWAHLVPGASGNYIEAPVIEDSTVTNSGNFVGRDNSGPQVSTGGGSIIGDSALKELMRSLPAQPVEPPKAPEPIPSMAIGGAIGGFYWEPVSCDGNGFCFDGDGKLSLSVLIRNETSVLHSCRKGVRHIALLLIWFLMTVFTRRWLTGPIG